MTRRSSAREAPLPRRDEALAGPGEASLGPREAPGRRCSRVRRRRRIGIAAAIPVLLVVATLAAPLAPRLVWNASASAPLGLYRVTPGAPIARGDMVAVRLPEPWRSFAARRRYLPANVPLVKRAAAVAGDTVCAIGPAILVNGTPVAIRAAADPGGRTLPWWQGCVRLEAAQILPLVDHDASFDGRYFGVVEGGDVLGKAVLLWRR